MLQAEIIPKILDVASKKIQALFEKRMGTAVPQAGQGGAE
jgi:hypothetical protein